MVEARTDNTAVPPFRKGRGPLAYSLGGLLGVVTLFCLYHAYRTNEQVRKYYTPAPVASFEPAFVTYAFRDEDFVEPFDPRPASAQLADRVQAVSDRVAELRSRGNASGADRMQTRLDKHLANRKGPYADDGKEQLHAFGLYDGGRTRIQLTYTGAPIVLALCSYERTHWTIEAAPGVQLKKVVVSGYEEQSVEGVAGDVVVEGHVAGSTGEGYRFYAYSPIEAVRAAQHLHELTGLEASTFLGTYRNRKSAFEIGPGNSEWTAQMTLRAIEPLYLEAVRERRRDLAAGLVQHSFTDLECTPAGQRGGFRTNLAVHSIFGPYASTLQPLANATTMEFAIDPRGPSFFTWAREVMTIDPNTGAIEPWPVEGLGDVSSGACLAFDTKRNRLLVWGRHGLSAIDVLTKQAVMIRKGRGGTHQMHALAYSPSDDLLYGLLSYYDSDTSSRPIREIVAMNHLGTEVSATKLALPIPEGEMMLRVIDAKLLLMYHGSYDGNHNLVPSFTNCVIDPQTGKVLFACQRKPR